MKQPETDAERAAREEREAASGGADFAEEHASTHLIDEQRDGPEHVRDPDSPAGWAGADPDRV